ncbi:transposase [Enterococcus faecium]|nr:transposase [Enterococcus faecium]
MDRFVSMGGTYKSHGNCSPVAEYNYWCDPEAASYVSPPLKEAYPFFHELVEAFRDKDPDLFFSLLAELPETLDDSFREKLQNLLTYEEGITNAMIYPYSNGKIEAKNTHIKTMKRVSYGFKSFENMRIRIFLINQLINVR